MRVHDIEIPSNRMFGFFFTAIFLIATIYSFNINSSYWTNILGVVTISLFVVTITIPEVLLPLNKLWMKFGFLLGMIISPVVMGVIFFGIFTPTAILMRLFQRDELRLQLIKKTHYWINREDSSELNSFKNQF